MPDASLSFYVAHLLCGFVVIERYVLGVSHVGHRPQISCTYTIAQFLLFGIYADGMQQLVHWTFLLS